MGICFLMYITTIVKLKLTTKIRTARRLAQHESSENRMLQPRLRHGKHNEIFVTEAIKPRHAEYRRIETRSQLDFEDQDYLLVYVRVKILLMLSKQAETARLIWIKYRNSFKTRWQKSYFYSMIARLSRQILVLKTKS